MGIVLVNVDPKSLAFSSLGSTYGMTEHIVSRSMRYTSSILPKSGLLISFLEAMFAVFVNEVFGQIVTAVEESKFIKMIVERKISQWIPNLR